MAEGDTMITRRMMLSGMVALASLPDVVRAATGEYVRVPVRILPNGRVHMPVTINGQGLFRFVLDTGADCSNILDRLAQSLNLPSVSAGEATGLGGNAVEKLYRAQSMTFGDRFHQTDVVLLGTATIGPEESGLIAAGFLTTLPSELDYGMSEVRIYAHGSPDLAGYLKVRSRIEPGAPGLSAQIYVHATLDGVPLKLLVDTGAYDELLLFPRAVKAHGLWDKYPNPQATQSGGVTGAVTATRRVNIPSFALGDVAVPNLPVTLMPPTAQQSDIGADGLLGSQFLKLFSMAVLPSGISLRPNSRTVITPDAAAASSSSV